MKLEFIKLWKQLLFNIALFSSTHFSTLLIIDFMNGYNFVHRVLYTCFCISRSSGKSSVWTVCFKTPHKKNIQENWLDKISPSIFLRSYSKSVEWAMSKKSVLFWGKFKNWNFYFKIYIPFFFMPSKRFFCEQFCIK